MLNITLAKGDVLGDLVPPSSGHLSPGNQLSARLRIGNALYSPGQAFRLHLQQDGNAVVEGINDFTLPRQWLTGQALSLSAVQWMVPPLWAAGTNEKGVIELDMQADGNLVIYSGAGPVFASNTAGNPGSFLRMQDDGNLVIYASTGGPIWSSGTQAGSH